MSPRSSSAARRRGRAASVLLLLLGAGFGAAALWWPGESEPVEDDAAYYRSVVTSVEPAVPGLTITVQGRGESITMENLGDQRVIVLGYGGERYVRLDGRGAAVNSSAMSAAINAGEPPKESAPDAKPTWRRVGDDPTYTWSDYRVTWTTDTRPPIVEQDPYSAHRVFDWGLPLTADGEQVLVQGAVEWVGMPRPASRMPYFVLAGAMVVVGLLGLMLPRRGSRPGGRGSAGGGGQRFDRVPVGADRSGYGSGYGSGPGDGGRWGRSAVDSPGWSTGHGYRG